MYEKYCKLKNITSTHENFIEYLFILAKKKVRIPAKCLILNAGPAWEQALCFPSAVWIITPASHIGTYISIDYIQRCETGQHAERALQRGTVKPSELFWGLRAKKE